MPTNWFCEPWPWPPPMPPPPPLVNIYRDISAFIKTMWSNTTLSKLPFFRYLLSVPALLLQLPAHRQYELDHRLLRFHKVLGGNPSAATHLGLGDRACSGCPRKTMQTRKCCCLRRHVAGRGLQLGWDRNHPQSLDLVFDLLETDPLPLHILR
jgi:hypothetical protein